MSALDKFECLCLTNRRTDGHCDNVTHWAPIGAIKVMLFLRFTFNMFRDDPKMTLKELVRRDTKYYFSHLESKILTNWIWGPRQNIEVTKTIIQPVEKVRINNKDIIDYYWLIVGRYYLMRETRKLYRKWLLCGNITLDPCWGRTLLNVYILRDLKGKEDYHLGQSCCFQRVWRTLANGKSLSLMILIMKLNLLMEKRSLMTSTTTWDGKCTSLSQLSRYRFWYLLQ